MQQERKGIKAVIFDLDGTLTDTEKYYYKAWPEAAAYFGLQMEPQMALELRSLGRPFAKERFFQWFGAEADYEEIRAYRKKLVEEMVRKNGIPVKPGAEELLQWLKDQKITVALATANDRERAEKKLAKAGLISFFDHILGADMVQYGKPAPDLYRFACRELQTDPSLAIAVEDSPNGVRSAYEAGCQVIMVPDLTEPDAETRRMLAACVGRLTDIIDIIEKKAY